MSSPKSHSWQDAWAQRSLPLVTIVPYVLLALLVGVTVAIKHATGGSLLIDLALCAAAAAWMLWMFTLHPAWRVRPAVMAVFLGGLIAIMAVLVIRDPWFGFFAPAGYFYAFRLFNWPWELAGIAGVAIVAGTAQASGLPKATPSDIAVYLAVLAINVLPMCGLAWIGWNSEKYNDRRERTLEEVNEANQRLAAALAENAGLHQQLMTQAREAGVFDERQRMAREIHDTLAQGLAGIITQLQALEHAEHNPVEWRRHLAAATTLARESLSEARRSVHELRPEPLETARLSEALATVAERWSALYGIPVHVTTTGIVRPMPPAAELALLRAAQEALANVAKHAQATRVGLTLSYLEHEVALDVRDDGKGFDPAQIGDAAAASDSRAEKESGSQADAEGASRADTAGRPQAPAAPRIPSRRGERDAHGGPAQVGSTPASADAQPGVRGSDLPHGYGGPRRSDTGGSGGGFGLVAMRQRIEGMSGTLQVESEPGAGTAISARLPMPAGAGA